MTAESQPGSSRLIGHGIDLVEVPDFALLLVPPASQFIDRHFTHTELAAAGEGVERTQRLAARFAVKEAVMKALGVGWGAGIAFTDVEVVATARGAPGVILHRELAELARSRGISSWMVSVSHGRNTTIASVLAVS